MVIVESTFGLAVECCRAAAVGAVQTSTSSVSAATLVSVPTFFWQLRLDENELSDFVNEITDFPQSQ